MYENNSEIGALSLFLNPSCMKSVQYLAFDNFAAMNVGGVVLGVLNRVSIFK